MRLGSGMALVVVPGRAPLCLRCRSTGHIRRDCRVPRCAGCHAFEHDQVDCTRSYTPVQQVEQQMPTILNCSWMRMKQRGPRRQRQRWRRLNAVATSEREMETPTKQDTVENMVMGTPMHWRSTRAETQHEPEPVISPDATLNMDTDETTPVKRRLNEGDAASQQRLTQKIKGCDEWLVPKSLGVLAACVRRRFQAAAVGRRLERRPDNLRSAAPLCHSSAAYRFAVDLRSGQDFPSGAT
ncbi:hypothetical protein HPB51_009288 [Rhipicephalus microplus]|uniref:CCHC-type domain-containing protein n=1 Tax=Rhipicephalus microplus TaxID=6941 RepID=A0A9J6F1N0_RHIMP|nr:hypothetical protein HPB51_009288 [Rhipicephalus microplus]